MRALLGDDQAESVGWLTRPLDGFGVSGSAASSIASRARWPGPTSGTTGWPACSTCGRTASR